MTIDRSALVRFMALYAALFSAFGFASPFLPAFLAGVGWGPKSSASCWVQQPRCGSHAVPSPGAWRIVSKSFGQNLPLVPFWPQALAFSTWQPKGFGR
jgi:hypothetical protein